MIPAAPAANPAPVEESGPISKTQRKRQMLKLQALGEALTVLTEAQLAELELPERLLDALVAAKRVQKFGARRRQLQYIGRLMREVDAEAVAARLDAWQGASRAAA